MKAFYSLRVLSVLIIFISCRGQNAGFRNDSLASESNDDIRIRNEFQTYSNGFIYDQHTMGRLGNLIDSLHVRYKNCEAKRHLALPQGMATVVVVSGDTTGARAAMQNNISLSEFKKRFPLTTIQSGHWMVKVRYPGHNGIENLYYYSLHPKESFRRHCDAIASMDKTKGWVIFDEYDGEFTAIYLDGLTHPVLPERYGALLQYVDCMVDTTTEIFTGNKEEDTAWELDSVEELPKDSCIKVFFELVNSYPQAPEEPSETGPYDSMYIAKYEEYAKLYSETRDVRIAALDKNIRDAANKKILHAAVEEAIVIGYQSRDLEFYAERYISAQKALQMKRSYRVAGSCSMDSRPRNHAREICILAAEAHQWDIFLRAHLDIMNDDFSRASDGSYAQGGRQTYLQELEALNINTIDLLLGTCLRASNTSENHYDGSPARIARALAESKDRAAIGKLLKTIISDTTLDLNNRVGMAWLLYGFTQHLKSGQVKAQAKRDFLEAIDQLPFGLRESFREEQ